MTVSDLMTILCDCVDSGTLDMDSKVYVNTVYPVGDINKPINNLARNHKVSNNCLFLSSQNKIIEP